MDAYARNQYTYEKISGSLIIAAATTTTTVVTGKTNDQIFVQRATFTITTTGAFTWKLSDTVATVRDLTDAVSTGALGSFQRDFGAEGVPCKVDNGLAVTISAAGAVGSVTWEGYRKRVTVVAA